MHYVADSLFVLGVSAAIIFMLILTVPVAVGAYVFYRSVTLEREIATRRVLGARRAAIVHMLLLETAGCILVGIVLGTLLILLLAVLLDVTYVPRHLLAPSTAVAFSSAVGGWLAARHASKIPFSRSGLFRGSSDKRGEC